VDLTLCLEPTTRMGWLNSELTQVMVTGHVNVVVDPLVPPMLPAFSEAPIIDLTVVVRAILIKEIPDMDLAVWNQAVVTLP